MKREIDSVVGHSALREIVGPDPLGAVARADHRLARAGAFAGKPFALHLKQPRAQNLEGLGLVLVLRLLVLLDDDEASREDG